MPTGRYLMDRQLGEAIQAQLAAVGIKAKIESPEWGAFVAITDQKKAPMFLMGKGSPTGDLDFTLTLTAMTNGRMNAFALSNPEIDKLILEQRGAVEPQKRRELLARAQDLIFEDVPAVVLFYEDQLFATRATVHDVHDLSERVRRLLRCVEGLNAPARLSRDAHLSGRPLLQAIPVLFGVSLAVFLMVHLIPGDPAALIAGTDATRADVENVRQSLGLDRPLPVQYVTFVGKALTGDFGKSFRTGRPVLEEIVPRYLNTVALGAIALAIAVAVRHGVRHRLGGAAPHRLRQCRAAALARRRVDADLLPRPAADAGVLGVARLAAAVRQGHVAALHPAGDHAQHGVDRDHLARHACEPDRGAATRTTCAPRARKASAKSLVIWRHAVRNALIPVVTVAGLQLGYLLGGAVVTETVFAWPGLGRLLVQSILARDFPVVQASVLLLATTFVAINLLTDLIYGLLDPRISVR